MYSYCLSWTVATALCFLITLSPFAFPAAHNTVNISCERLQDWSPQSITHANVWHMLLDQNKKLKTNHIFLHLGRLPPPELPARSRGRRAGRAAAWLGASERRASDRASERASEGASEPAARSEGASERARGASKNCNGHSSASNGSPT